MLLILTLLLSPLVGANFWDDIVKVEEEALYGETEKEWISTIGDSAMGYVGGALVTWYGAGPLVNLFVIILSSVALGLILDYRMGLRLRRVSEAETAIKTTY